MGRFSNMQIDELNDNIEQENILYGELLIPNDEFERIVEQFEFSEFMNNVLSPKLTMKDETNFIYTFGINGRREFAKTDIEKLTHHIECECNICGFQTYSYDGECSYFNPYHNSKDEKSLACLNSIYYTQYEDEDFSYCSLCN